VKHPFAIGDLVACVDDGIRTGGTVPPAGRFIKNGGIYRVEFIGQRSGLPGVRLAGDPNNLMGNYGWHADRFQHLRPSDDEFARQMRACRPVRDRLPA
jgi:hypothetical protein